MEQFECSLFDCLPKVRYGTEFKLYIFILLLENQKVIHSFANRAQPSSHKAVMSVEWFKKTTLFSVCVSSLQQVIKHPK